MLAMLKRAFKRLIEAREAEAAAHIRKWRESVILPPAE